MTSILYQKINQHGLIICFWYVAQVLSQSSIEDKTDLPIIRQINKVNDDGTYTYGYEAADGSFKIETRDVLGNVKGMFGFIDESGHLKRVSYTATNETGFKATSPFVDLSGKMPSVSPSYTTVSSSGNQQQPARRPVLVLKNTVHSSTRGPVIQHIPKKGIDEDNSNNSTPFYGEYINRKPPLKVNSTEDVKSESTPRKILVSKRPVDEKNHFKGKGGNLYRRQLYRGIELRPGDAANAYTGPQNLGRFEPPTQDIPPPFGLLMSELRPIEASKYNYPDDSPSSQNEAKFRTREPTFLPSSTPVQSTTELPITPRYKYDPATTQEASTVHQRGTVIDDPYKYSLHRPQVPPVNPRYNPLPYSHTNRGHYPPISIPPSLRDELLTLVYNFLQARLGAITQDPYYDPGSISRYPMSPYYPNVPFIPNGPYNNPYGPQGYVPYMGPPPYFPPYFYPNYYPHNNVPYIMNPNIQSSSSQVSRQAVSKPNVQPVVDDVDLLQTLLASPTQNPNNNHNQYSLNERRLPPQSIRNVQIVTDSQTHSPSSTTETSV